MYYATLVVFGLARYHKKPFSGRVHKPRFLLFGQSMKKWTKVNISDKVVLYSSCVFTFVIPSSLLKMLEVAGSKAKLRFCGSLEPTCPEFQWLSILAVVYILQLGCNYPETLLLKHS